MTTDLDVPKTKHHSMALISQMFMPTTYAEAMKFCELAAKEDFVPTAMKNKPMTLFLAWQMGANLGLDFFASIQNIAVINGRPSIWGDAALAVVISHPHYIKHREWFDPDSDDPTNPNLVAHCMFQRKGQEPQVRSFSVKEAIQAKLWGKAGPWTNNPKRMLAMRARGFCLRDTFADALKGMAIREEVIDLPPEDFHVVENKEPPKLGINAVKQAVANIAEKTAITESPIIEEEIINPETGEVTPLPASGAPSFEEVKKQMENAKTVDDLIVASDVARSLSFPKEQRDELATIYKKKQTMVKA